MTSPSPDVNDYECGACGSELSITPSTGTTPFWRCDDINCKKFYNATTQKEWAFGLGTGPITYQAVLKQKAAAAPAPAQAATPAPALGLHTQCFNLDGHEFSGVANGAMTCKQCGAQASYYTVTQAYVKATAGLWNPCPGPKPAAPYPSNLAAAIQQLQSMYASYGLGGPFPSPSASKSVRIQVDYDTNETTILGHKLIRSKTSREWSCEHCDDTFGDNEYVWDECPGPVGDVCTDCKRELCDALDWSPSTERWSLERCAPCRNKYERSGGPKDDETDPFGVSP